MPFDLRRRCELALTRLKTGSMLPNDALQEIFRLMKLPEAQSVRSSDFQAYVDAILATTEKLDKELEGEVYESWRKE